MDIHGEIKANKIKTIFIIILFPLILGGLLYGTLWLVFANMPVDPKASTFDTVNSWAGVILPVISVISILWMLISYYKGGNMMMSMAGAKEIYRKDNPEIYSLVQNVAATAGAPVPRVFIIPTNAMNAFATGRDPEHAAIALTTGIITRLNRPELEAVIAHEMGHIINRDIRLTMLISTGIGILTLIGEILLRVNVKGKNNQLGIILKIIGLVLLIYGAFLAPIIMFAMSRNREYLADATSAYLTRNPEALASALEKISGESVVKSIKDKPLISAACIEKASLSSSFMGLFSTHPPIAERVRVLRGA